MMASPSSNAAVPMRWPAAWADPALISVLKDSPVNCILDAPKAVADAARAKGLTAVSRAEVAASVHFLPDPQWPGVRPRKAQGDGADAGPTGAPWVDANAWAIRLATALHSDRRVWVEATPEKDTVLTDASYQLALAEPQALGAQWVITLDDGFAKGLASGDGTMKTRWSLMMETLHFFARRPARTIQPVAAMAVISDFTGDNEFLGREFLNMADRRSLQYSIVPKRGTIQVPPKTASLVFVDEQAPDVRTAATLQSFVRDGGLLIASRGSGAAAWGTPSAPFAIPGYASRQIGKGRIAVPDKAWTDPWVLASEVRILTGRRTDVLRLYNPGMVAAVFGQTADGSVLHLLNYGRRRSNEQMTVATAGPYAHARAVSLESPTPRNIVISQRLERFSEIPIPAFAVYSAIDLSRS